MRRPGSRRFLRQIFFKNSLIDITIAVGTAILLGRGPSFTLGLSHVQWHARSCTYARYECAAVFIIYLIRAGCACFIPCQP